jgi:ABC-type transport system substrate-binding protein
MRLIVRRIALYVVTAVVAITINFFLPRLMPGNPALAVLGKAQSTPWPNVTTAPLNDPQVRLAISAGINRAQLSAQGETSYEPRATSSTGLLLPEQNTLLDPAIGNDLSPAANPGKVSQILTRDGYTLTDRKWIKNGQPIKFSIEDPSSYTDYATDATLVANQLNSEGFEVTFDGVQATQWYSDVATGNFQAVLRWSNQGPTPWDYYYIDPVPNAPYMEYTLLHLTPASGTAFSKQRATS